jgi:hypothetical protein
LQHVPDELRPQQEALDPDEDINDWSHVSPEEWERYRAKKRQKNRTP